jgi:hypothetical protein
MGSHIDNNTIETTNFIKDGKRKSKDKDPYATYFESTSYMR